MTQYLEKDIVDRLKKKTCLQEHCLSQGKANLEFIVFDATHANKNGLMCSECLIQSQLVKQLLPMEFHVLSIKKFMRILTQFYNEYAELKKSVEWGPNIVKSQKMEAKKQIEQFQSDSMKAILQVAQYAQITTQSCKEALKKLNKNVDFDKIVELMNEENEVEQDRMNVNNHLKSISENIRYTENMHKYSNEEQIRKESEVIIFQYKKKMILAIRTLRELIEVHKQCLKQLVI